MKCVCASIFTIIDFTCSDFQTFLSVAEVSKYTTNGNLKVVASELTESIHLNTLIYTNISFYTFNQVEIAR